MRALYRGFSLKNFQSSGTTKLQNMELVKANLLSHIYTSRGERLNMTTFGTRIPNLLFEPLTSNAVNIVQEDLQYVFSYDPRVRLLSLNVQPVYEQNAIVATGEIEYLELNLIDSFNIQLQFH